MITLKCKECHIHVSEFWARIRFEFPEEGAHSILSGEFCSNCIADFTRQNNATIERIETL